MPDPFVTEERRFAFDAEAPLMPQVMRLILELRSFMGDTPGGQGVRVREVVVILERPVSQHRGT